MNSLENLKITAVISITVLAIANAVPLVVQRLDAATVQQCMDKHWPQHQDAEHTAWCAWYLTEERPLMQQAGHLAAE